MQHCSMPRKCITEWTRLSLVHTSVHVTQGTVQWQRRERWQKNRQLGYGTNTKQKTEANEVLADDPCDLRTHGHTHLGLWLPPSSIDPNVKTCDNLQRQQEKEKDALQLCYKSSL